jgi:hypothetical protein
MKRKECYLWKPLRLESCTVTRNTYCTIIIICCWYYAVWNLTSCLIIFVQEINSWKGESFFMLRIVTKLLKTDKGITRTCIENSVWQTFDWCMNLRLIFRNHPWNILNYKKRDHYTEKLFHCCTYCSASITHSL